MHDIRRNSFLAAAALAALAAGTLSLRAVQAQEKPAAPAPAEDDAGLVKALGDPDFAARTRAFDALKARGAEARAALEEGAKSEDAQVRWSSGRLLRMLDGGKARRGVLLFDRPAGTEDEEEAAGGRAAVRDLHAALEEMRRRFEDGFEALSPEVLEGHRILIRGDQPGTQQHVVVDRDGERAELSVAADGKVKVVLRSKDGKEETFEAASMEALEKEQPAAAARLKALTGDVRIQVQGGLPLFRTAPRASLGVMVSPVPDLLREHLPALAAGEGLVIEEIVPKSIAERIGLKRHDILLSLNGIPVATAEDVRGGLGAVKEGGELRLRVLRAGQPKDLAGTR